MKVVIKVRKNGYGPKKFMNKNRSPSSLNKLLTKSDQTVDCKPAEELVLSRENNTPDTHKTGICKTSMQRIVKQGLNLQCETAVL